MTEPDRTSFGVGPGTLSQLREATADLCEVKIYDSPEEFLFASKTKLIARGVLVYGRSSALKYDRTPTHVARSGRDHYQVTLLLNGMEFCSGKRTVLMRAGDTCLIDNAQSSCTCTIKGNRVGSMHHTIAVILPRDLLAPLLAFPDSVTGSVISRDSPHGYLIAEKIYALYASPAASNDEMAIASIEELATLVAAAVGCRRDSKERVDRSNRRALIASIKSYIHEQLESGDLRVAPLCRYFRLSRATIFRLFEADGGLSSYIQNQRLHRAFTELRKPHIGNVRVIDLASDFGFASESTFIRAFHRRFGLTPGEVKRLSASSARWLINDVDYYRGIGALFHRVDYSGS